MPSNWDCDAFVHKHTSDISRKCIVFSSFPSDSSSHFVANQFTKRLWITFFMSKSAKSKWIHLTIDSSSQARLSFPSNAGTTQRSKNERRCVRIQSMPTSGANSSFTVQPFMPLSPYCQCTHNKWSLFFHLQRLRKLWKPSTCSHLRRTT